jgi:hypothetical protein
MSVVYLEGDSVKECKEGEEQNRKGRQQHRMTQVIIMVAGALFCWGPPGDAKDMCQHCLPGLGSPGIF